MSDYYDYFGLELAKAEQALHEREIQAVTPVDLDPESSTFAEMKAEYRARILAEEEAKPVDLVNHPPHYGGHPSGVECITVTRWMNFNLGNAVKYIWRAGSKDGQPTIQDLEKAVWYINDEIKRLKGLAG